MHKYDRGQAVILASSDMAGATILAATNCARIGAGVVRVIVPDHDAKLYYQTLVPSHIIVTTEWDGFVS
jgi:NAD(P)H-hydrate repair Nnr-like enzyme with NAD(P)H-hydrate dehydratase domain